jgi:hypothetical protein
MTLVTASRFAVRINHIPTGQIIAQGREPHVPAIANEAMEQIPDPLKRGPPGERP